MMMMERSIEASSPDGASPDGVSTDCDKVVVDHQNRPMRNQLILSNIVQNHANHGIKAQSSQMMTDEEEYAD